MPFILARYPFASADWGDVQTFDCGGKPYQREVSDWLKGSAETDSALAAIERTPPVEVWLYRLEDDATPANELGEIVGFGALAPSQWRWTGKKDPFVPITTLIWLAVQTKFKRQPIGNADSYYSSQILDDLIAAADAYSDARPILGLCVRPENTAAIDLYRRKDFVVELSPFKDKITQVEYLRMARILDAERLKQLAPSWK